MSMLTKAIAHPTTFGAAGAMAAAAGGYLAWFGVDPLTLAISIALALALTLAWVLMLATSDGFKVSQSLSDTMDAAGDLKHLASELAKLGLDQGLDQLKAIGERHANLVAVLKRRLNEGEIAYGRYVDIAQQVYLAAIDGLREATITAQAASNIDVGAEQKRLAALKLTKGAPEAILALEQRIELGNTQKTRLQSLLDTNESAVTVLDRAAAALAATKTTAGPDAESAIRDLEELAQRTGRYAAR